MSAAADPTAWAALIASAGTVGGLYWKVRTGIQKDRAERIDAAKKARKDEIDLAVDAALEHQRILQVEAENAELRRRLGDAP